MTEKQRDNIKQTTQSSSHHDDDDHENTISQISYHIPPELILEIVPRLPSAKSIVRSRAVSKLWSSITTTPDFINSFQTRSSPSRPCVLLLFKKLDKIFFFFSPLHQNKPEDQYPDQLENTFYDNGHRNRYDSVNGLMCLKSSTQFEIWNPTMRRVVFSLPKPAGCHQTTGSFLGYDPVNGKYKAVCILTFNKIGILTLGGAQESWKIISKDIPEHVPAPAPGRCINGVIYYEAFVRTNHVIMCFDLRSEELSLIEFPNDEKNLGILSSYEGRLAFIMRSNIVSGVDLWILEDAENHKWILQHFGPPPLPCRKWMLRGFTDAGEFIYVYTPAYTYQRKTGEGGKSICTVKPQESLYGSFSIAYFDPKKSSIREVKHGGISGDDIRRLDEVGFDLRFELSVIPNHIESLISSL
ncbi:hypothetical protein EUTSA_v10015829mg [Eutrema salsugineum]|uniref:F-box associated beta-propeller type 3 domain-containing protein n=1 Tax=Eutrema salsugineum TaxID=72664 RepID=V4KV15_EUTSA|nr:putative F-box protein At4g09190 [Eutrema salsugineum]ESQ41815.1 hypothetical protein EUTSA_v10015829mg [Eutrema salsugineum]